jgi:hypothetical protein
VEKTPRERPESRIYRLTGKKSTFHAKYIAKNLEGIFSRRTFATGFRNRNVNLLILEIMPRHSDWIKSNHGEFKEQGETILIYILDDANRVRMNFDAKTKPGEWLLQVVVAFDKFKQLFTKWSDEPERSHALQYELEQAEKNVKAMFRQLYTSFLKTSPFVTNEDLIHMGLPERNDGPRKPAPVATSAPFGMTRTPVAGRVEWHFYSMVNGIRQAKPEGQHGAEIRWEMQDSPVTDQELLRNSDFCTRSPFIRNFTGNERGKSIYYAMRWENTRGEKGPWSPVEVVYIP